MKLDMNVHNKSDILELALEVIKTHGVIENYNFKDSMTLILTLSNERVRTIDMEFLNKESVK